MSKLIPCLLLWCAPLVASAAVTTTPEPVPRPGQIEVDGRQREYLLVTPSGLPAGPRPLVLLLHGHLATAANALGAGRSPSPLSAWLSIAAREQILVAALQGVKGSDNRTGWNDCRADADNNPDTDDVAFAAGVTRRLVDAGRVDPQRIYVMGMSNGAFMSLRLALQMQPRPAAIASVAGAMAQQSECPDAPRAVSVLLIHGTADPLVPYGGGEVGLGSRPDRGGAQSVAATRDYWLQADGLQKAQPVHYRFPHQGDDDTSASRETWGPDKGPQVEVIT
ncbi:MAG TPA: PHB depolymerase family esterase, partial [Steroidobacteraceae bacterium]|nr:PHB depolymerase family esterase [Steroidobacteraceae bacterium]